MHVLQTILDHIQKLGVAFLDCGDKVCPLQKDNAEDCNGDCDQGLPNLLSADVLILLPHSLIQRSGAERLAPIQYDDHVSGNQVYNREGIAIMSSLSAHTEKIAKPIRLKTSGTFHEWKAKPP